METTKSVQTAQKSKKGIIIAVVVVVLLALICCCTVGIFGGVKLFSSIMAEATVVKEELIYPICTGKNAMSESEYENWFTSSFRATTTYPEAKALLDDVFPSGYVCGDLYTDNIFEMMRKNESFNVNITGSSTTATLSFATSEGRTTTFELAKVDNEWKVASLSKSIY